MLLSEMSKDERSLLLYLESVSVDSGGLVNCRLINDADRDTLKMWDEQGFISYSRLTWDSLKSMLDKNNRGLVVLSEEAWRLAHGERRARNARLCAKPPVCNLVTTKMANPEIGVLKGGDFAGVTQ